MALDSLLIISSSVILLILSLFIIPVFFKSRKKMSAKSIYKLIDDLEKNIYIELMEPLV